MLPIPQLPHSPSRYRTRALAGFTLVELLAVIAIMVLLIAFTAPAIKGIQGGQQIVKSAYDIAGALEQARTYAMANNTYTWVGLFEESNDALWTSTGTATSGTGRIIISVVASKDGTRYSAITQAEVTPATNLIQVSNLLKLSGTHLDHSDHGQNWPMVPTDGQVSATGFQHATLRFPYPLTGTAKYQFSRIIEFNPSGEASRVGDSFVRAPQELIGIGLKPTRGSAVDPNYPDPAAAVLLEGLTGRVKVYQP